MTGVMEFLAWLETSAFAVWVRESPSIWAYPTILTLHTIGLGLLVGANATLDLRILGVAPRIPLAPLEKLFPIMWMAFGINAVTGVALFMADATAKARQPVFFVKLVCIALGLINIRLLQSHVFRRGQHLESTSRKARVLASTALVLWAGAITAGRLMAYL